MFIKNKKELYDYLNNCDFNKKKDSDFSSVYFLIEFDNKKIPIYFVHFENSYFESKCILMETKTDENSFIEYVKETYEDNCFEKALKYEYSMYKNGIHYEIVNPHCYPFLPKEFKIKMISEQECLKILLKNKKGH